MYSKHGERKVCTTNGKAQGKFAGRRARARSCVCVFETPLDRSSAHQLVASAHSCQYPFGAACCSGRSMASLGELAPWRGSIPHAVASRRV